MTLIWTDNPRGPDQTIIPQNRNVDLGTAGNPFNNIYANNVVTSGEVLPNNTFLEAVDAAGTGILNLLKGDASDNTVLNVKTAKKGSLRVNDVEIGSFNATAFTFPVYNLSDGADKNHSVTSYASGTAYNLTNTSAKVTMGTSSAELVLDKAGTYLLISRVNYEYSGATFASNRTVTTKLHRTNNTPADVTGSSTAIGTNVVTTVSGVLANMATPPVIYTTANTNDIIDIYADVSVVPSAGNLQATEACIVAIRLY